MIGQLVQRIEAYWNRPIPAYPIAAFRILFGLYLLIYFLSYLPYVELLFSNQGVYTPYRIPDIAPAPFWAWVIYLATLLLMGAFTIGFKTRWITPLMAAGYLYHFFLNLATAGCSFDRLIIIFLGVMCFANLDAAWSIKAPGQKTGTTGTPRVAAWPTRILAFQIAVFYLGAGLYKLFSPPWHTGQMVQWTLPGSWSTPLGFWFASQPWPMWFWDTLTWGIIVFECLLGFGLYCKPVQKPFMIAGTCFHLLIWWMMNIPQFMLCVLGYVLFMQPDTVYRYGCRLMPKALSAAEERAFVVKR